MMNEPVSTIMTHEVITATSKDSLATVYHRLLEHRIHHLPIVKGKKLIGLLTTYDLFKLGKSLEDMENISCEEIMTTKLATLDPKAKVGTAAEIFMEHLFHALPVVNEKYELVGIVTSLDVMEYSFKKEYPKQILRPRRDIIGEHIGERAV